MVHHIRSVGSSSSLIVLILNLFVAFAHSQEDETGLWQVPASEQRQQARAKIASTFGTDVKLGKSEMSLLSGKLLEASRKVDSDTDPTTKFVLLNMSRELAADAGDIAGAMRAITIMENYYKFDVFSISVISLRRAGAASDLSAREEGEVLSLGQQLLDEKYQQADFENAEKLCEMLIGLAKKFGNSKVLTDTQMKYIRLKSGKPQMGLVSAARAKLKDFPRDSEANWIVARHELLHGGGWETAAPLLAFTTQPPGIAAAMEAEKLAAETDGYFLAGKRWVELGNNMEDPKIKPYFLHHALTLFHRVKKGTTGLPPVYVQREIQKLEQQGIRIATNTPLMAAHVETSEIPELGAPEGALELEEMLEITLDETIQDDIGMRADEELIDMVFKDQFEMNAYSLEGQVASSLPIGARRLQESISDLRWASFNHLDVLGSIDVARHKISDGWRKENGVLFSPTKPFDRIRMPFVFPEQYDLLLSCEKIAGHGNLVLSLPAATGHRFLVSLNGQRPDFRISGLETIDGVSSVKNSTRYDRKLFQDGQRSQIQVSVRRDAITVTVDEEEIIRYAGPQDVLRCRGRGPWQDKHDLTPVLGSFESRFAFHQIVLRSFTDGSTLVNHPANRDDPSGPQRVGFRRGDTSMPLETLAQPQVYLDATPEAAFFVGAGTMGLGGDKGYGKDPRVMVDGQHLRHAISTHPPPAGATHVQYHLNGEFRKLTIQPGVSDSGANAKFQLRFTVYGDGRVLKRSETVSEAGIAGTWKIDVTGVQTLLLMVECGKNKERACAIWANPLLEK